MYNKKRLNSLTILGVFIAQLFFANVFTYGVNAASSVSEEVYEIQPTRQILMSPTIESSLIGDVNGDGNRNSIDFAYMRMVLLGLRKSFAISNATWAADADGNGVFNSIDFAYMRMFLLGKIKVLPAEASNVTPTPTIEYTLTPTITPIVTATITPTEMPTITPTATGIQNDDRPSVPEDFHYITKTESSVTLAWESTEDNVSYDIYVDNSYFTSTDGNAFTVRGLEKNTSYGFSVVAKDDDGNCSDSTEYIVVTTMDTVKTYKFKKITGVSNHTIALNEDGTVWAWGSNSFYQLGNDREKNSSVPIKIDKLTDIVDVSLWRDHSLALRKDGTVWAWGNNNLLQCGVEYDNGVNSDNYRILPTKVYGLKGVEQICATSMYSFILKEGSVWFWGGGNEKPTKIEQINNVKQIFQHEDEGIILIKKDDTVWESYDGVKFSQILGFDDVKKIVSSLGNYIALKNDGSVWIKKGVNSESNLVEYLENVKDIELNLNNDCIFLMEDGTVYKWSRIDINNKLITNNRLVSISRINGLSNIEYISSAPSSMFFIRNDGLCLSMGSINNGKLGNGLLIQNFPKITEKEYVFFEYENIDKKNTASNSYCGEYELLDNGTIIQVSDNSKQYYNLNNISNVVKLYDNRDCIYALKNDGTVWAWGKNKYGQLGDGTTRSRYEPVKVENLSGIIDIIVGWSHYQGDYAIAIKNDGTLWAWGRNDLGQLGDGTIENRTIPVKLVDENKSELSGIVDVKIGFKHAIALRNDGTVWSWGKNYDGQLGDGTNTQSLFPKKVIGLSGIISILVNSDYSIALKDDGTVWSWGENSSGQLGNSGSSNSNIPVKLVGLNNVIDIKTDMSKSLFLNSDYTIWECGSSAQYDTPVRVTMENDANLRYITINNSFLESFDEDITEYNVTLPVGTTKAPNVGIKMYNPYATYNIVQPDTVDGIAIIKVTAWDGETTKTYKIKFNQPNYAEYRESLHYGESGTGASGNFSRTYTDMTSDAPGFQIAFSRTYNSKNMKIGSLGRGWTFGFESRIEDTGYIGVKKLTLPDGSVNLFEWDGEEYIAQNSRNKLTLNSDESYLLTTKDQYTYHYNDKGFLDWMKDRSGNVVTIDVSSSGRVRSIEDQCGRTYDVNYEDDFIKSITDIEGGRKVDYNYKNGNLWYIQDPCGIYTQYNYSEYTFDEDIGPVDILYEVLDGDFNVFERIECYETGDNKGKISRVYDKNGNKKIYNYYPNESRYTVIDSNEKKTSYWYDESYYDTVVVDSEGGFSKTTYYVDENGENKYGEVLSVQDRNGNKTIYERDDVGNVIKIKNPDKSVKEFGYDSYNNVIWEKDEEDIFVQYVYEDNLLKQKAERMYQVRTDDRSEYPKESDIDSEYYNITDYDYYNYSSTPDNDTTYKVYGLLKSELQNMGDYNIVTEYKYHPNGSLKSVKNPQTGELTLYSEIDYGPDYGWMNTETSPKGNVTEYHYNDNGQVIEIVNKDANDSKMVSNAVTVYDNCGRKKQEVSPNLYDEYKDGGNDPDIGTRYSYNDHGQLETLIDAEGNITRYHAYDIYGNVQIEEKPNGGVYKYEYDSFSRPLKVWFKDTMDTADTEYKLLLEYSYLKAMNPVKIEKRYLNQNEVARTTYTSDYAGRSAKVVYPSTAEGEVPSTSTSYYANGKIKEYTDKNGYTTSFVYDNFDLQRVRKFDEKWTPVEIDGTEVKYNYQRTYYDKAGRVIEERTSSELVNKDEKPSQYIVKTNGYYKDGKLKYIQYNDGRRTDFEYDLDRTLNKETTKKNDSENIVVQYENNYFGKPDSKKLYVDKKDLYYNEYTDSGNEVVETIYTYDKEGNIKSIETDDVYTEEDLDDRYTITYTYDNLGRKTGTEKYVVAEDGTARKLTNKTDFNWQGKPVSVKQLEDDVVTRTEIYSYNQRGLLETFSDALPAPKTGITYYAYDLGGRMVCEVAPEDYVEGADIEDLNRTVYTYDRADRVLEVSYVGKMSYFDENGELVEQADQAEILQKSYTYDKAGNILKEADGQGNATQYTYNPSNKVKAVLDAEAEEKGTTIENAPKRFNYDALGRKVEEITVMEEKDGTLYKNYESIKSYIYNDAGDVEFIKVRKDSGTDQTIESANYDYLGNVVNKTDGNENITTYEYNNLGKVRKVVTPGDESIGSNTLYYQYDKAGNLKKTIDTKGSLDSADDVYQLYTYDNRGKNLSYTVQKQDGSQKVSTSSSYDTYGNKRFETDGNEITTTYEYNELNKLVKSSIDVFDVDDVKTTHTKIYDYDKNGNLLSETDHLNNSVTYTYDSLNRLREKEDQNQNIIQKLNYNDDNTQSESFDALGNRTVFEYDKNNNLISTTDAEGYKTSNTYDVAGNVKTKDDGRANITYYGYDEFGRLTEVSITVDDVLQTTSYVYDLNGNMTSQNDGENKTIYNYNVANKLKERYVDGQTDSENYFYYADGNIFQKEDKKGIITTYTYYADGNLESQTVGESGTEGFVKTDYQYDDNSNQTIGKETSYNNGALTTVVTEREYDELNRVKVKSEYNSNTSEENRVVNKFKYDIVPEDLPGITDSLEGTTGERSIISKNGVEMSNTLKVFDKAGRLKYVVANDQTTTYDYYDNGNRKSVIYPGGLKEEYEYYKNNLLMTLKNYKMVDGVQEEIDNYHYTYDAAHNQDTKTEIVNGIDKGKTTFIYDELNRLKSVLEPSGKLTEYGYDAAGNRKKEIVSINGATKAESTYIYNEMNWLKTVTKVEYNEGNEEATITTFDYDKNGNQTGVSVNGVGTVTYGYDNLNRLTKTLKDGKEYNYLFNADGLRIKKSGEEGTTVYLYESSKVVMELDADGNMLAKNVYGTNLLTRTIDGETLYYMYNGHADVTALIDTEGNIVGSYYYDVWGNIVESSGEMKDKNSILYAGYQYDSESDLYYLNARMYDPKVARFLQEDTYLGDTSDTLSLNLYTYCVNNPLVYWDPTGHYYVQDLWIDDMKKAIEDAEVRKMMFGEDIGFENARSYLSNPEFIRKNPIYEKRLIDHLKQQDWFIENNPDENHLYRYKIVKDNFLTRTVKFGFDNVPFVGKFFTNKIEKEIGIVGGDSATSLSQAVESAGKESVKRVLEKALKEGAPKIASSTMKFLTVGEYVFEKGKEIIKNNGYTTKTLDEVTFKFLEQYDKVMKEEYEYEDKEYKENSFYSNDLRELEERVKIVREYVIDQSWYFLRPIDSTGETFFGSNLADRSSKEGRYEYELRKRDFRGDKQTQNILKCLIINGYENIRDHIGLYNRYKNIKMNEFYKKHKNKGAFFSSGKSEELPYPTPQPNAPPSPTPIPPL